MQLRDKIKYNASLQYVVDNLELMSSAGRRKLLEQPFMVNADEIEAELSRLEHAIDAITDPKHKELLVDLRHQLMELHDIRGTLSNLTKHVMLDEIDLFEIKFLSFHTQKARSAAIAMGMNADLRLPDVSEVFAILDPDNTGIAHFYIYDSYNEELPALRAELRSVQTKLEGISSVGTEEKTQLQVRLNELLTRQNEVQAKVCQQLTDRLFPMAGQISEALESMAYTDMLLAKAFQSVEWNLQRPKMSKTATEYKQLFLPHLLHNNAKKNLRYQPVDITLNPHLCIVTGANMAGKTVLLKSLCCAQLMMQFGMNVPACDASIMVVDDVEFCIGDDQNEMNGLSSYAAEIIKISSTIKRSETGRLLILIDEPARTTNPVEGKAIVQSIATILNKRDSLSVITTHYGQLNVECNRLRVKGFVEDMSNEKLTPESINRFMDYSLLVDNDEEVPHEALRIAAILGCDESMIELAKHYLNS